MSKIVTLTGSGTYTPTAGIKSFLVTVVGAGGGSGGVAFSSGKGRCSGGAGGGSWAQKLYVAPLAANYSYACGTGGAAGTNAPGAGGNGGATTFDGSTISAPGGLGSGAVSLDNFAGSGSGPAIATGGDINVRGVSGETSVNNNWNASTTANAGFGGGTPWGAGGNRLNAVADTVGNPGTGAGGGAGGSAAITANVAGAAGADGAIIVQEFS